MAGQPNIHKKMDKILQKLTTPEANDKGLAKQTNYLAQLVVLAKQDSACQHQESQAMLRDMGQMLLEVRKILGSNRGAGSGDTRGNAPALSYDVCSFVRSGLPATSESAGNKTAPCLHSTWTRISISIPKPSLD